MAWVIQNNKLVNTDGMNTPSKPFIGDSPYIMWRITPGTNDDKPYLGLMIGVPALAPHPTLNNIFHGSTAVLDIYYGSTHILNAYVGTNQVF